MHEHPVAEAERELRYVRDDLRTMREAAARAETEPVRAEAERQILWLTSQETLDVINLERVRAVPCRAVPCRAMHCRQVWVPAGMNPNDTRVCARCKAERGE